ncbi:DsbA family oxidoreductase [Aestuariispira insulae]|uniref:Putative DsbA family dithiol-disulfide isomerase n=1 Tax=Aestuariispira insulae TaxID=1461337 RepID=A0A3D9HNJ2_9PROT|nr:DsbA family oxidoreductase [Aestuariispira insulae]RED51073.1 putative DsbA family dithiol-disulfide isomerase [Aestuariispira insulae]
MDSGKIGIEVFSDPICPWCFIGKRRLEEALDQREDIDVEVTWRTFQLNPQMPADGMDRREYLEGKFGGPENADRVYGNIARAGQTAGIDFAFDKIQVTPNTQDAHRLIRLCQNRDAGLAERLVKRLFEAYFLEGRNIGDRSTLVDLAGCVGLAPMDAETLLLGKDLLREILEEDNMARRLGVNGVPCFIIDGQFALSGAQEAKAFFPLFDLAAERRRSGSLSR